MITLFHTVIFWPGVQRHPEASQRPARAGEAVQAFRHEEVPAECQQRTQTPVPGAPQAGNPGESSGSS